MGDGTAETMSTQPENEKALDNEVKLSVEKITAERTRTDDVLTVIFILECVTVLYNVHNDLTNFTYLALVLPCVALFIRSIKSKARELGNYLSETTLNTTWTPKKNRRPLRKEKGMHKFVDQLWQVCFGLPVNMIV